MNTGIENNTFLKETDFLIETWICTHTSLVLL